MRQLPHHTPTPWTVVWAYRWLLFRIMLGAVSALYFKAIVVNHFVAGVNKDPRRSMLEGPYLHELPL